MDKIITKFQESIVIGILCVFIGIVVIGLFVLIPVMIIETINTSPIVSVIIATGYISFLFGFIANFFSNE